MRGRPIGSENKDKPFREALRVVANELADGKIFEYPRGSLRWNAQILLLLGEVPSITQVADRLDGKPAQETNVTVVKRDANDWTRAELEQIIREARAGRDGVAQKDDSGGGPNKLH
jgi:hypothetical protein